MNTTRATSLAIVGLLLALSGCQPGNGPPPLFLGHVTSYSGTEHIGKHAEQGISLALKQLTDDNLPDALAGRPLEVRHTDTRDQLDAYESEAVRLASLNRVIGLIGGTTPDEVVRLDRGRVPLVTLAGVRPPGVSDLTFAIGMRPGQQAFVLARHAVDGLDAGAIAVFVDERREDFVTVADAFVRQFTEARQAKGKALVVPVVPQRFGKDAPWDELARTIARRESKTLLFAGKARDAAELLQRLPYGVTLLFAGDEGDTAELRGTAGRATVLLATAFVPDPAAPRSQAFVRQYRDGFKAEPDVAAALGYEALQLHAEALKQISPAFTHDKLAAALREIKDFPGLAGPLTMTADQRLKRPLYLARLDHGVPTLVHRFEPAVLPALP